MTYKELIQEVNKLNIQDKTDVVALASINGKDYEFDIIGIYQYGMTYIELEVKG